MCMGLEPKVDLTLFKPDTRLEYYANSVEPVQMAQHAAFDRKNVSLE